MSLASRIGALASRVGLEVKSKIDATHPGVARAWVCFGYVGNRIVVRAAHNVASGTQRLAIVRSTSDQKTAEYVDLSCATTAASFSDSAEINLVVFR